MLYIKHRWCSWMYDTPMLALWRLPECCRTWASVMQPGTRGSRGGVRAGTVQNPAISLLAHCSQGRQTPHAAFHPSSNGFLLVFSSAFHEVSVYPKKELPFFILFTAGLCSFTAMLALLTHQFPELMGVFAKAVSVH